jgi:4-hydroxy-tetrahydrodipicolinate synthase
MFRGSIPALVTPFRDEAFDEARFRDLVEWQIAKGATASCRSAPPASPRR